MKIAVFGDLHYPAIQENFPDIRKTRDQFFRTFLTSFFSVEADLYVSIGDLTNYGLEDELTEVFQIIHTMNKPFIHVIGNHDAYGLPKGELVAITQQPRYTAVQNDNATLLFLDSAKEQDFEHWGGTLEDEQLQWLSEQLAQTDKPTIVFAHHPVYNTTMNSEKDCLSVDPSIPLQRTLETKAGLNLYVNGHNHYNSIHRDGDWTYMQIAAVLDEIGARLIEVKEKTITVTELTFNTEELREQANCIGESINHFRLAPDQLATEQDRNLTIHLTKEALS